MSAANAAAIRRRANIQTTPPPVPMPNSQATTNNTTQPNSQKLTLTQYITTLDQRIKNIEDNVGKSDSINLDSKIIEEYNSRFEILANEIGELKDVILKLQSFTMEVNKSLYDDRIQIMSDIPILPSETTENKLINQLVNENENSMESLENKITDSNTTSVDIKTMVEEEISASNGD